MDCIEGWLSAGETTRQVLAGFKSGYLVFDHVDNESCRCARINSGPDTSLIQQHTL